MPRSIFLRTTVLLMGDTRSQRTVEAENQGYCVTRAASAQEGLEIFATQQVDAVILDYAMPDLNGDAVLAMMKKMKPGIPIVMFTGVSEIGEQAQEQVDAFVTKGCPPNVLLKTIDALLQIHDRAAS